MCVKLAIFSDRFGLIMKKLHCKIPIFLIYKGIILSSLYKKIREVLVKEIFYRQISDFLLEIFLDSHNILRLPNF